MRYRQLGDSDLQVSEVSLGSWLTYSGGVGREQAEACTRAAFDAGITFFDTANVYGRGASEEAWGEILSGFDRDSFVLATKVYFPMSETDRGLSAAQIHKQLDASLARLRTSHVDLYQCHRYDERTPLDETVAALSEAIRAGKARCWGFSEWTAEQIDAAVALADEHGWEKPVSSQPQDSLLWRAIERNGVLDVCRQNGISQVVWSPLAQGVLTGKYRPGEDPPEGTRAASEEMGGFIAGFFRDDVLEAVQRLRPDRRRGRAHHGAARARLGAAGAERRLGHHRRDAARAGARERRRRRGRALRRRPAGDRRGARRPRRRRGLGAPPASRRRGARGRRCRTRRSPSRSSRARTCRSGRRRSRWRPSPWASSTRRSVACWRPSASIFVMPLSSPPTSDLNEAPICEPTLRERTVSPKTSPSTSSISYPGRSFMVEMSMGGAYGARTSRRRSIARWLTRRSQARTSGAARRSRRGTRSKASSKRTPVRAGPSAVRW